MDAARQPHRGKTWVCFQSWCKLWVTVTKFESSWQRSCWKLVASHLFLRVLTFSYQDPLSLPRKPPHPYVTSSGHSALEHQIPKTGSEEHTEALTSLPQKGARLGTAFTWLPFTAQSIVPKGSQLNFPLTQADSWFGRERGGGRRKLPSSSCLDRLWYTEKTHSPLEAQVFSFILFNIIMHLAHWSAFHVRRQWLQRTKRRPFKEAGKERQEDQKKVRQSRTLSRIN